MSDLQSVKRLVLPALKGLHIIIGISAICGFLAYESLKYVTPQYESVAKIKLDHGNEGLSSSNLFDDFDVFHYSYKVMAEEELIRSKILINRALDNVNFDVSYFRIGEFRNSEIYEQVPFRIELIEPDTIHHNATFSAELVNEDELLIKIDGLEVLTPFEVEVFIGQYRFYIHKNNVLFSNKTYDEIPKNYLFTLHARHSLIAQMLDGLDVKALDKDIPIIRVSYRGPQSRKVSDFLNALLDAYIEDYVVSRSEAARKTLHFIDTQLDEVKHSLEKSERDIEQYRLNHNIINTRQETETDLRKISQLRIQLSNLTLSETALDSLDNYMNRSDVDFLELAPNFEAFTDLLSTELIKKVKLLQSQRKDLLVKYTEDHQFVKNVDAKIKDIADYFKESIGNTRKNLEIKRRKIESNIAEASKSFEGLPTKEKQMLILERNFLFNQKTFNFLTEKRMEAAIAHAAQIAFHRIIQRATITDAPVFPNRKFLIIVAAFVGFMTGLALVYIRAFLGGTVSNRQELEKASKTPICGIVKQCSRSFSPDSDFDMMATNLQILFNVKPHQLITITSTVQYEGKTFVAHQLAKAFARMGQKVLLLDMNLHHPQLHHAIGQFNTRGINEAIMEKETLDNIIQQTQTPNLYFIGSGQCTQSPLTIINHPRFLAFLDDLKTNFDLVLIDTPSTAISLDAIALMKLSDHAVYTVRAGFTKYLYLLNSDMIREEYGIQHMKLVLNCAHRATNYNGNYTGSRYTYDLVNKGTVSKIKHYAKTYLAWR